MNVLGIVCSPRKAGNTEILVKEALAAVEKAGGETQLILLADKKVAPCDACGACRKDGVCIIDDDMQDVYARLESADGVIFGTPVYLLNVTAQAKALIDRTYAQLFTGKLRGKVAGAIVTARRMGATQVLSLMYGVFSVHGMISAGGGIGYGVEKGDVLEGPGGLPNFSAMKEAGLVGKNVARMIKKIS